MPDRPQSPPPRKHGLPYYKRYPRDFIEGTIGMPGELKGAYSILLDLIYIHAGQLPDDPHYIAGVLGYPVRTWTRLRKKLIEAGKIECKNGLVENYRASKEQLIINKFQSNQRLNITKRWDNKDLPDTVVLPARGVESDTDTELRSLRSLVPNQFEKWWKIWPNKVRKKAAAKAWAALDKSGNVKYTDLMAGVERYIREKPVDRDWLHPATWLNGECWNDAPAPIQQRKSNSNSKSWATVMKEIGDESDEEGIDGADRRPLRNAPKPIR